MKKKTNIQKVMRRKVTLTYEDPNAKVVYLMGDFNDWNPKKHPMKHQGNGIWTKSLILPPGTYEYKFMVDGKWKTDPGNPNKCINCYGTYNHIISMPAK